MRGQRAPIAAALVAAVTVVGACGVTDEEQARRAELDDVPFGLLDDQRTSTPTSGQRDGASVTIFLVGPERDHLIPVERGVRAAELDELDELVTVLLAGPTDAEAVLGLGTALDDPDVVRSVTTAGGVASVDLTAAFTEVAGGTQLLAVAQLVYTLTAQPGIGRVAISVDGRSVEIPRGDGTLTSGSVSRDSYSELVAGAP